MLNAYPVKGKAKSHNICAAFLAGCGGNMVTDGSLRDGPAMFYGVDESNLNVWHEVLKTNREYWYADNSYFDGTRGTHFRMTKNRLQHNGLGRSNGKRFQKLGIVAKPWRMRGDHVVLCPQSDTFMKNIAGVSFNWTETTRAALSHFTWRELLVREWDKDKTLLSASLPHDLTRAHALVTWSSAAAVTALLDGVPVVTGPCVAKPMSGDLVDIEFLPRPERQPWLDLVADNQFTLDEFRDGTVWRALNG